MMIYLNSAGHGLPDSAVRQRMIRQLQREEEIGPIQAEAEVAQEVALVRGKLADLLAASEAEIAIPAWTTTGWNAAVLSLPVAGKRVLAAPGEWGSNVALLQRLGARVEVMPLRTDGALDLEALAGLIDEQVAAICMPIVCSLTGERYPAEVIGALARPDGCAFVVDAAQALGQMPVSVQALNADILVAPTRKWLRGPRGTGVLYVRQSWLDRMQPSLVADYGAAIFADGTFTDRDDARRFEPMGCFAAQHLGLSAALDVFNTGGAEAVFARIAALADHARSRATAAGFALAGAEAATSGIVTLRMTSERIGKLMPKLAEANIVVKNAGADCEPLRTPDTVEGGFLRISANVYNSETEIDEVFDLIG